MRHVDKALNLLNYFRHAFSAVIIMAIGIASVGCASSGRRITTESLKESDIPGAYTLILYGGNYAEDLETAAFLDREGDAYRFDIFAPDFNYRVIQGVSAKEGFAKAREFVSGNTAYHDARLSRIVLDKSGIIGYEVRPLYRSFVYGIDDLLDIWYAIRQDNVVVTIKLKPSIEHMKLRDDFRLD